MSARRSAGEAGPEGDGAPAAGDEAPTEDPDPRAPAAGPDPHERVGLCADCRHARVQRNARGSEFWRCQAADERPGMLRYPPIPVRACPAFASRHGGLPWPDEPAAEDE